MYLAEIKGKLQSKVEKAEDILTSNVFSFFKYADRNIYLGALLRDLDISITPSDLEEAEFLFWPRYDDNTEPDLVIIVGKYYLLFEAKYFSDFGGETKQRKSQLMREIEGGKIQSNILNKEFVLIAITADYCLPKNKFKEIDQTHNFKWINWQKVSNLIITLIEEHGQTLPNYLFAADLYSLLQKKNLRSFRSFSEIRGKLDLPDSEELFFSGKTASFRGKFIGFSKVLTEQSAVGPIGNYVFFTKQYFNCLKFDYNMSNQPNLFFKGRG